MVRSHQEEMYDDVLTVALPVLQGVIAVFSVWFASRVFHTLLVRRDDIAVATFDVSHHDETRAAGQSPGVSRVLLASRQDTSVTATDIRSSFASAPSKRPSTLDAHIPATAPTHAVRVGSTAAGPAGAAGAGRGQSTTASGVSVGGAGRQSTAPTMMSGAGDTAPLIGGSRKGHPDHRRPSYDALGGGSAAGASTSRPGASVRFTSASGPADDRSMNRDPRHSAAAVIAGRPSNRISLGGALTRMGTQMSATEPLMLRPNAAFPIDDADGDFARATRSWRVRTLKDHHVRFYVGCILTGLATATTMLAIVLANARGDSVDPMSLTLNATSAIAIACLYSTVVLLVTLLNHWALDLLPRCWRAVPVLLVALVWASFVGSNTVSFALPDNATAAAAPLYLSGGWAGALALSCIATSVCTVPCHCRQMQAALMMLFVSLVAKVVFVIPQMQDGFVSSLGNMGYMTLWGATTIVPLAAVFVTVHWHRPDPNNTSGKPQSNSQRSM